MKHGRLREIWALKDASFTVEQGTILGIVGPNGAGKTTLLKLLARITPPTSGRVRGRGRVVPLLALGSGFQRDLSGRENVYLNAAMFGFSAQDVAQKFDEIVEFADLADAIDQPVKQYSSGMYLRLAFSVAVNLEPDILLADEVLAVGDLEFQERCLTRVAEASRQGITVLFVSHDMAAISRLCTRALMLSAGDLLKDGSVDEVVEMYQEAAWTGRAKRSRDARNEWGELLFVKLQSLDELEIGAARCGDEVAIALGFRIDRPGVFVRAACDVFCRGILAFRTVQAEEFEVTQPGTYTASVRIPAGLLAETVYGVNAAINLRTNEGPVPPLSQLKALSFRVYDALAAQSAARGTWRGNMPGVIAPRLTWQVASARREADVNA
jgi:lipopolysaccharide transport system ATP-binding protein